MSSDGGKGSTPRPFSVDGDTFASNWDMIFRKTPSHLEGRLDVELDRCEQHQADSDNCQDGKIVG